MDAPPNWRSFANSQTRTDAGLQVLLAAKERRVRELDPSDDSVIRWHAQDLTAVLRRADGISFGEVVAGLQLTVAELFDVLYLR